MNVRIHKKKLSKYKFSKQFKNLSKCEQTRPTDPETVINRDAEITRENKPS